MTADEAIIAIVQALESLATNVYGVPRATDDGDFVLELPPGGRISDIAVALPDGSASSPRRHSRR